MATLLNTRKALQLKGCTDLSAMKSISVKVAKFAGVIAFCMLSGAALFSEGISKKFHGYWIRYVDGKPLLSKITQDRIDEHECDGMSVLTDAVMKKKDCYIFADSGGDGFDACFQLKKNTLHMESEARGQKFTSVYKKYSGTLVEFKKKYCSVDTSKVE